MAELQPLTVFLSSTCYDLADLRAELATSLRGEGMNVLVSEDPQSGFCVEPTGDSIVSCLKNVESSDVVVAVIDGRSGPPLPHDTKWAGRAATYVEIEHAQSIGKPVLFFIREIAYVEYQTLKRDPAAKTYWVKGDHTLWLEFLKKQFALPQHADRSNWFDQFKSSVDLRSLALTRLVQAFPQHAGTKAMHPDRLVRLTFRVSQGASEKHVYFEIWNAGIGPAFDLRFGLAPYGGLPLMASMRSSGALREGEAIGQGSSLVFTDAEFGHLLTTWLTCEYSNRFGDRYRIDVPLLNYIRPAIGTPEEHVYVRHGSGQSSRWIEVPRL